MTTYITNKTQFSILPNQEYFDHIKKLYTMYQVIVFSSKPIFTQTTYDHNWFYHFYVEHVMKVSFYPIPA